MTSTPRGRSESTSRRLFARSAAIVTALALAVLCVSAAANAQAVPSNITSGSTAPCVSSSTEHCLTASTSAGGSHCTPFPNGMFWQNTTDDAGNPIQWTYANGSSSCVTVTFTAQPLLAVCQFWLYIPEGFATAKFTLGWTDTAGNRHTTEAVNENSTFGWSLITMFNPSQRGAAKVTQLHFSDGNNQSFPTQLGWGQGNFGIAQVC